MKRIFASILFSLPKPVCLLIVNGLIFLGINIGKRLVGPRILHLTLPSTCDHNCPFCITDVHGNGSIKKKNVLTYEKIIEIIDNALDDLTLKFNFTSNGEPLLYGNLEKLIIHINNRSRGKADIQVITNATSIKEDKIEFYKKNNVSFWISLHSCKFDSWKKVHRPMHSERLKFDKLMLIIRKLSEAKIKITVHCVVTKLNFQDLIHIPDFLILNHIKNFSLTRLIDHQDLGLDEDEEANLGDILEQLKEKLCKTSIQHNLDGFEIMLQDADKSQVEPSFYEKNNCYINFLMKPITEEGVIKSCNAGYSLGSVYDESIDEKEVLFRKACLNINKQNGLVDKCQCDACPQLVMNKIANQYRLQFKN